MRKLNRRTLRKMILNEMAGMTGMGTPVKKVVEMSLGSAFFFHHEEFDGGVFQVDEIDEIAGVLVALKNMGFTHVYSREDGTESEIGDQIHYFDGEDMGGRGQYSDYYGHKFPSTSRHTFIDHREDKSPMHPPAGRDDDDDDDFYV